MTGDRPTRYPNTECRTCVTLHQLCEEFVAAVGRMSPVERAELRRSLVERAADSILKSYGMLSRDELLLAAPPATDFVQ